MPVAPVATGPLTYNVGPAVPERVTSLAAFVEWCKANPDKALYATTAAGGTPHFVGVMFAAAAGLKMTPIHYRGGAPALQDLVGGHVPASINPMSEALPLANSGRLRILAVSSTRRSKFLPDVPTIRQPATMWSTLGSAYSFPQEHRPRSCGRSARRSPRRSSRRR